MICYPFSPFSREKENRFLFFPELSDGFDPDLPKAPSGLMPVSFFTEEVPFGIYRITLSFTAEEDIPVLYLFTGRRQLREILSLKKGELFSAVYYQSASEIIPRYQDKVFPVRHLFFTICTGRPENIRLNECSAQWVRADHAFETGGSGHFPDLAAAPFRIFLCGDSTVTDHSGEIPYHPGFCYSAWGQALPAFLTGNAAVENQAHCGLTTEDFRKEGHWNLVAGHLQKDDICLFQFGHNDQKLPHLWPNGAYTENLGKFIRETREMGGYPVLVTPLGRNTWTGSGEYLDLLEEHSSAVKTLGRTLNLPVIDLHGYSVSWIRKQGMEKARSYFHPNDYTHTNEYGACFFARWIAGELAGIFPERLGAKEHTADFTPPPNLWDTFGQRGAVRQGTGKKEQFDQMEKSTAGLLAGIAEAKKKAYNLM